MRSNISGRAALVALTVLLTTAPVSAAVITFEGHGDDDAAMQVWDGFTFTFNADGWGIFTDGFVGGLSPWTQNGTTRLVASGDFAGSTAYVDIARTDATWFNLNGFDAATMFPGYKGRIEVIGTYGVGGSVSTFFDLTDGFSAFALPGTFVNLSSVRVQDTFAGVYGDNPGSFSLDNIDYDAVAVPGPATLLIFGMGLAVVGRFRRRQIPCVQARDRSR